MIDEATYPHYLGNIWLNGNRARRIKELIEKQTENGRKYTVKDAEQMQMDLKSPAVGDLQQV